jgi:hypothetical protein
MTELPRLPLKSSSNCYVPRALTFINSAVFPTHCIYAFLMILKMNISYLQNGINYVVFIMGMQYFFCEIKT